MSHHVITVGRDQAEAAADVLATAFEEYPTMRYLLPGEGAGRRKRLKAMVGYLVDRRVGGGGRVLAVSDGGRLVAAALVDPPRQSVPSTPAQEGGHPLLGVIGADAYERLRSFDQAITPLEPDHGFFYVGMIGVLPDFRGAGHARAILDEVASLSAARADSRGVLLTTEDPHNVAFYESLGFEVLGETSTPDGGLRSWTLFRADP